jgi:hypothetical protein
MLRLLTICGHNKSSAASFLVLAEIEARENPFLPSGTAMDWASQTPIVGDGEGRISRLNKIAFTSEKHAVSQTLDRHRYVSAR